MFIKKIYKTGFTIENKLVFNTWSKSNNCIRNITKNIELVKLVFIKNQQFG